MRYKASIPTAVLGLFVLAACDSSELVSPDPVAVDPVGPKVQVKTSDDEFARASRAEAPGFAGFYLDEDGTPVIRLVDTGKGAAARQYLASRLSGIRGERNGKAVGQPVFRPATYDFAQMKGWADGLAPMLDRDDVYSIDVDEKHNRVSVGVKDAGAIAAVRAEAARLGVPAAALNVQTQAKPEQRNVQAFHNSVYGGIQIAFGGFVCTQGFNATRVATGQSIFVTNSHCTPTYFGPDGGAIFQPTNAPGNQIGSEVADIGLWDCGGTCRWADAAYIAHNGTRGVPQGVIARTPWPNPISITEIFPSYRVVARYNGNAPVGTWLDKTGRTSGSTYGQVTQSCVTINVGIGNLACQDISTVYSAGGDSGSPIYIWLGGTDVQLQGILWGGPSNNFNITYSSPLVNIERDLGPLSNVCAPGFGC